MFISFKFIGSPMSSGENMHEQNNRKYSFKSALENSRTQIFGTEFNESEETNEDTKDIDIVAKISLSISLFFTFRALLLRKSYLPSWIFTSRTNSCQQLFVLFLNFRI
jgi:hypothetical protein